MTDESKFGSAPASGDPQAKIDSLWDSLYPPKLNDGLLLKELQGLIGSMPPREAFVVHLASCAVWTGEAAAVLEHFDKWRALQFRHSIDNIGLALDLEGREYGRALAVLHEVRRSIELRGEGLTTAFADKGNGYDCYKPVREAVAQSKADLMITDRYLNAEFVDRYFPSMTSGTAVRLMVRKCEPDLLPAVELAATQYRVDVQVRGHSEVHDRFIFSDQASCFHSSASIADGAKFSPAVLVPMTDFSELLAKYEAMWAAGTILR